MSSSDSEELPPPPSTPHPDDIKTSELNEIKVENSESDKTNEDEDENNNTDGIKQYRFKEIEDNYKDNYWQPNLNRSAVLDLIALYLKGQRILYTEAKTLCEQRLNYFMLPTIFNSTLCSVLSMVLQNYNFGPIIVSVLNGVNVFILALISYLKLDARAEAHRNSAYKFDKLQSKIIFNSGKTLFDGKSKDEDVLELINEVEQEVYEIKETNQFVLPELIRMTYPDIYGSNIFSEVKIIMQKETKLLNQLKEIMNEREESRSKLNLLNDVDDDDSKKVKAKSDYNSIQKRYLTQIELLIDFVKEYEELDNKIESELNRNNNKKYRQFDICSCLKN